MFYQSPGLCNIGLFGVIDIFPYLSLPISITTGVMEFEPELRAYDV